MTVTVVKAIDIDAHKSALRNQPVALIVHGPCRDGRAAGVLVSQHALYCNATVTVVFEVVQEMPQPAVLAFIESCVRRGVGCTLVYFDTLPHEDVLTKLDDAVATGAFPPSNMVALVVGDHHSGTLPKIRDIALKPYCIGALYGQQRSSGVVLAQHWAETVLPLPEWAPSTALLPHAVKSIAIADTTADADGFATAVFSFSMLQLLPAMTDDALYRELTAQGDAQIAVLKVEAATCPVVQKRFVRAFDVYVVDLPQRPELIKWVAAHVFATNPAGADILMLKTSPADAAAAKVSLRRRPESAVDLVSVIDAAKEYIDAAKGFSSAGERVLSGNGDAAAASMTIQPRYLDVMLEDAPLAEDAVRLA